VPANSSSWLPTLIVVLLGGCGGVGSTPLASYETFTLSLENATEGQELHPLDEVKVHVVYKGDLARNLRLSATITDLATGGVVTETFASETKDAAAFDLHSTWKANHSTFRSKGRYEVTFTATIVATVRGSEPWATDPAKVVVLSAPQLDSVVVTGLSVGAPTPYATPLRVTVAGKELWGPVRVSLVDLDRARSVPEFGATLPFEGTTTGRVHGWNGVAMSMERVGVIQLQVVAEYGDAVVRSEPFSMEITHMVDSVGVQYRDQSDVLHPATSTEVRFDDIKAVVVSVKGTNLVGHLVRLNNDAPFIATADDFQIVVVPSLDAFPAGLGTHHFSYNVSSGGSARGLGLDVRRWKLESCGWAMADGSPLSNPVPPGTRVVMRASGWGFPDTSGILLFKKNQADFTLWERDDGQNTSGHPEPYVNNDDQVDTFKVDVRNSVAEEKWTTVFDEEVPVLGLSHAEYYFEVTLQDQTCTSGELTVPEK